MLVAENGGSVLAFERWGFLGSKNYSFPIIKSWSAFNVVGLKPLRKVTSIIAYKKI